MSDQNSPKRTLEPGTLDKTRKNMNMSNQNNLCVTEGGQYRTHTEKIYSQKIRRIKKRSINSWLYFNVYI